MQPRLKPLKINIFILLFITFFTGNIFAVVTVGSIADGCDYDNLLDAYNDNDPVLHITSQTNFVDTFTISKQKSFIGGYDDCDAAANGTIGENKTLWRRFKDRTVVKINANQSGQSLIIISNFSIFNGRDTTFAGAGGMSILGKSSVLISNSEIHANTGDLGGGIAISGAEARLVLTSTKVFNNTSQTAGGGIYCESAATVIVQNHSAINANTSNDDGGGIHAVLGCQVTLNSGDLLPQLQMQEGVFGNVAENNGAGIYAKSGADIFLTGDLTHPASVSFNGTNANTIFASGAGIYAKGNGTTVTAVNARIDLNFSQRFGAGVVIDDFASFSMDRLDGECWDNNKCSTLSDNFTLQGDSGSAAGDFNNAATAHISQTYIANNQANNTSVFMIGNAAFVRMEGNVLTNNTSNSQPFSANLISLYGSAANGANLDFFYNTVSGNNADNAFKLFGAESQQTIDIKSSIISVQGNVIDITGPIQHAAAFDCLIVNESMSLIGNVGSVSTANPLFVNAINNDYHLSPNSPAIDYCDESFVQSLHNDLNGNARGIDAPDIQNLFGVFDLGAYEYQANDIVFSNGFE